MAGQSAGRYPVGGDAVALAAAAAGHDLSVVVGGGLGPFDSPKEQASAAVLPADADACAVGGRGVGAANAAAGHAAACAFAGAVAVDASGNKTNDESHTSAVQGIRWHYISQK